MTLPDPARGLVRVREIRCAQVSCPTCRRHAYTRIVSQRVRRDESDAKLVCGAGITPSRERGLARDHAPGFLLPPSVLQAYEICADRDFPEDQQLCVAKPVGVRARRLSGAGAAIIAELHRACGYAREHEPISSGACAPLLKHKSLSTTFVDERRR